MAPGFQLQVDAFILRNFKHDAGDNGLENPAICTDTL